MKLTIEEVEKALQEAWETNNRDMIMLWTGYWLGMQNAA